MKCHEGIKSQRKHSQRFQPGKLPTVETMGDGLKIPKRQDLNYI